MLRLLPLVFIIAIFALLMSLKPSAQGVSGANTSNSQISDSGSCVDSKTLSEATGIFDAGATLAYYNNLQINYPGKNLAQISNPNSDVLSAYDGNGTEKWIEVDLEKQLLTAWDGNQIYLQYPISSGLFDPTPKGTYAIYWKIRYIRMTGGDKAKGDFYDLPNVPDTMFFYEGYGLHGAYWHNNFGHPMSHGCVNEPLDKAHELFEWAGPTILPNQDSVLSTANNQGSKVWIH